MNFNEIRTQHASSAGVSLSQKAYMWMTAGLLVTAAVAFVVAHSTSLLMMLFGNGSAPIFVLAAIELGIVFFLSSRAMTLSRETATALFFAYAGLNGLTLAPIFIVYTGGSIMTAFLSAAGMFASVSVYGAVTKRDLSGLGSFCMMGIVGLVIAMIVNMFVGSVKADLVISLMAVLIFSAVAAYDSYRIRMMASQAGAAESNLPILFALTIYLDFINIFIHLLRLMGRQRR